MASKEENAAGILNQKEEKKPLTQEDKKRVR